jgi:hypothetical protein
MGLDVNAVQIEDPSREIGLRAGKWPLLGVHLEDVGLPVGRTHHGPHIEAQGQTLLRETCQEVVRVQLLLTRTSGVGLAHRQPCAQAPVGPDRSVQTVVKVEAFLMGPGRKRRIVDPVIAPVLAHEHVPLQEVEIRDPPRLVSHQVPHLAQCCQNDPALQPTPRRAPRSEIGPPL